MKIYALIAVASACFLITSCTNDDVDVQNLETTSNTIQNDYYSRTGDSITSETDPVKVKTKD
jgi:hypothetical protein